MPLGFHKQASTSHQKDQTRMKQKHGQSLGLKATGEWRPEKTYIQDNRDTEGKKNYIEQGFVLLSVPALLSSKRIMQDLYLRIQNCFERLYMLVVQRLEHDGTLWQLRSWN